MKPYNSTRMGVSVLAGGLAFVGTADATELIIDGSFENTTGSSLPVVKVGGTANPGVGGGWSTFSTYLYSTRYTMPGPADSGLQYLRPYPSGTYGVGQSSQVMTQLVSLTASTTLTPVKIDQGLGRFTMSAWFSSYRTQGDYSSLSFEFLDGANNVVGEPLALGGSDFIVNIPTEEGRYPDTKTWLQDLRDGTIPSGARTGRVIISATSVNGAPDGYVDVVSLDVVDTGVGTPTVATAIPGDNAVNVGPVVNISVTLQDRASAVNTNSIQLFLDNLLVTPSSIQKVETNTIVQFAAGLLPALSAHTYKIAFGDSATPTITNEFRFTVTDYLTLPASLGTPLGSEDSTKPGFNVNAYQIDTLIAPEPPAVAAQIDLPGSIAFSEAVLAGIVGPNVADLTAAEQTNRFVVPGVIDWIAAGGVSAHFQNDEPFPGIPGVNLSEASFVEEIETYLRFPAAGYYQMGINNDDQFRLTAATSGYQTLEISGPTNSVIASVPIATNITQLQFGGALPVTPLTGQIVYGTPTGLPDDSCLVGTNTALAGKIVLLDHGATNCTSAFKAEQAQAAGAIAVLFTTPGDEGFPARIDDINPNVRIPVLVIAEKFGGELLKMLLNGGPAVNATIRGEPNFRIAEWDGPKGFGAVDVNFGFAVPAPGVYPMRLVAGQVSGPASLEWFSIQPDGTRILINDTSNPAALRAFRARTEVPGAESRLTAAKVSAGVSIAWTGPGTLQEATAITGGWTNSPVQTNPQTVPATGAARFYRLRQ